MKDSQEEGRKAQRSISHSTSNAEAQTEADRLPAVSSASRQNSIVSALYPFVDENTTPLPRCWNSRDKYQLLSLTHNDLRAHYKGQGKSHKDAAAVRATHSIPICCGLYYFEVRIISKGRDGLFGIGLSQAGVSLNRLPGWDKFSYGYHGDDGHSFCFSGSGAPYGPTFSTGDVIGCGLNLVDNCCFYTKNGFNIGIAFTDLPPELYPTVGLQTPGEIVEANFGQSPFVYNIYEDIRLAQEKLRATIETYCLAMNKTDCFNKLVSSYLVHHGYSSTAESFNKLTSQTSQEDADSIQCREKISKLVMNGRIGEAIKVVNHAYPGLLDENQNLLFLLKCRQFVEMVAGNDEVGQPVFHDSPLLRHRSSSRGSWSPASASRWCTLGRRPAATIGGLRVNSSRECSPRSCSQQYSATASTISHAMNSAEGGMVGCRMSTASSPRPKSSSVSPLRALTSQAEGSVDACSNGFNKNSSSDDGACPLQPSPHANGCLAEADGQQNGDGVVAASQGGVGNGCPAANAMDDDDGAAGHGDFDAPPVSSCDDVDMEGGQELDEALDCSGGVRNALVFTDANIALVHFGRELHQLGLQIFSGDDAPKNQTTAAAKELKIMQNAFSLMAYSDPWKSPLCDQLRAEQREPVAAALNSCILKSSGFASKALLEIIVAHAQRLRDEMAKAGLGSAAFADPLYYTTAEKL